MIRVYAVDDWVVIYRDGVSMYQGHQLDDGTLCRLAGIEYSYHEGDAVDAVTHAMGRFPHTEEELKGAI